MINVSQELSYENIMTTNKKYPLFTAAQLVKTIEKFHDFKIVKSQLQTIIQSTK